ncbi:MAG: hypothetical protein EXS31_11205 [Pedosphaera sp.]|nr:hypothetical protein [Pedosphaera sp.]
MKTTRLILCVAGVLLQLPCLALWLVSKSDHSGSHGPGSMGLVLPAIICGGLWIIGGLMNALLLVLEGIKQSRLDNRRSGLVTALGILTLIWAVLTVMFLATR